MKIEAFIKDIYFFFYYNYALFTVVCLYTKIRSSTGPTLNNGVDRYSLKTHLHTINLSSTSYRLKDFTLLVKNKKKKKYV